MRSILMAGVLAAGIAVPAVASERTGYRAISTGNWQVAEQELLAQREKFAARPELMLNLAAIYVATRRNAEALALYRQVQAQPPVALDMADGRVVSSHAVASRGLQRLAPMVATR